VGEAKKVNPGGAIEGQEERASGEKERAGVVFTSAGKTMGVGVSIYIRGSRLAAQKSNKRWVGVEWIPSGTLSRKGLRTKALGTMEALGDRRRGTKLKVLSRSRHTLVGPTEGEGEKGLRLLFNYRSSGGKKHLGVRL